MKITKMEIRKMEKVVIALDFNPTAQKVAETGFLLAKSMNAEVILLHVITDPALYPTTGFYPLAYYDSNKEMDSTYLDSFGRMKEKALEFLDKTRDHLGDETIQTLVKEGGFAETIMETAKELNADIIVMGSHSQKWLENILLGSTTEKVLRDTAIPLFIVPIRKNT